MSNTLTKNRLTALRKLQRKKYRHLNGQFLVEGARLVEQALASPGRVSQVLVHKEAAGGKAASKALEAAKARGIEILTMTDRQVQLLCDTDSPQGIVAVASIPKHRFDPSTVTRLLVLDGVQDPGNVGTLIRSAWCFGYDVMLTGDSADRYGPKVVRGSMGGIFYVKSYQGKSVSSVVTRCREAAVVCLAAAMDGRPYREVDTDGPLALIIGSEAHGLDKSALEACHETIGIPMVPGAESLNAGVAGSILMQAYGPR